MTETPPASLAEALAVLQTRLPKIGKNATGQVGTRNYGYADLASVSADLLPVLGSLGLSFTCRPTWVTREDGTREFVLAYRLLHTSGERDEGEYPLGGNPSNHQALGSAITYGRRYCLCAVTGAVAEDDDDGHAAYQPAARQPRGRPPARPKDELPRNADGSVSRGQTTDEEKKGAGIMTDDQQGTHNALERRVLGVDSKGRTRNPQGQHSTATPDDDPWYGEPGSGPPPSVRAPRAANVAGEIHAQFKRLGFGDDQRDVRLKVMSTLTGRAITSTNDLTAAQALDVKRFISACKDAGVLAERLLTLQQETPDAS
jgi:hypothetical protein